MRRDDVTTLASLNKESCSLGRISCLKSLFPGHRHAFDHDRRASSRAAPLKIITDGNDIFEHFFQIAGDGDLFYGIGQFSVFNPNTAGSARKVTGHKVHAKAEKIGKVQTIFYASDDLFRSFAALFKEEIA